MSEPDSQADPWTAKFYPREGGGVGFERAVFFSDAVYAIALTLVAVEIGIPELEGPDTPAALFSALVDKGPRFAAYAVAFVWVALYWRANHRFTSTLRGVSTKYLLALLVYLGFVAILPIPASTLGEYSGNPVAIGFFAIFAALVSAMEVILLAVAQRDQLFLKPLSSAQFKQAVFGGLTPVVAFLVSIPVAFVSTWLAVVAWLVLALLLGWVTAKVFPVPRP